MLGTMTRGYYMGFTAHPGQANQGNTFHLWAPNTPQKTDVTGSHAQLIFATQPNSGPEFPCVGFGQDFSGNNCFWETGGTTEHSTTGSWYSSFIVQETGSNIMNLPSAPERNSSFRIIPLYTLFGGLGIDIRGNSINAQQGVGSDASGNIAFKHYELGLGDYGNSRVVIGPYMQSGTSSNYGENYVHPPYDHGATDSNGLVHQGINLGNIDYRWDTVYANNTTIVSSDERDKMEITDSNLGRAFIKNLRPVKYKWKRTGTRFHYGLIAQEVKDALIKSGARFVGNKTEDFAGYIYREPLTAETISDYTKRKKTVYDTQTIIARDADGEPIKDSSGNNMTKTIPDYNKIISESWKDDIGQDQYGLRYSEFLGPMITAIQEIDISLSRVDISLSSIKVTGESTDHSNLNTISGGPAPKTNLNIETSKVLFSGATKTYTARTDISCGQPVCVHIATTGEVTADAIISTTPAWKILGIATKTETSGNSIEILTNGFTTARMTTPTQTTNNNSGPWDRRTTSQGSINLTSGNSGTTKILTGTYNFYDSGGSSSNYSSGESRNITFDAGQHNIVYIKFNSFKFEHSSYSLYDRLGIQYSTNGITFYNITPTVAPGISEWCYASSTSTPPWSNAYSDNGKGYGTIPGGWILPSEDVGDDDKGNDNVTGLGTWLKINARAVKFYFKSDTVTTEFGWNIDLALGEATTGGKNEILAATLGAELYIDKTDKGRRKVNGERYLPFTVHLAPRAAER